MKDIRLPEFGMPDDFVDLRDIVKLHTEQDSLWAEEISKVTDMVQGSGVTVYGTPDQSSGYAATVKCQYSQVSAHAVEIREIHSALMEQHRFPYANTCEDLFIKWSEYERSHPLK
jgi:hypothetical protein